MDTQRRRQSGDEGRVESDAAAGQGLPTATISQKRQEQILLEPPKGAWPCPHPDRRLPASISVRENISAALSPQMCDNSLQPQEICKVRVLSSPLPR